MADTVSSTVLDNGSQWFRALFTNFSDGGGEINVVKIDPTSNFGSTTTVSLGVVIQGQTLYPGKHLKVMGIRYNVNGGSVQVQWKATTNQDMWTLSGFDHLNFQKQGGIYLPAALTGGTGAISFTTNGFAGGSSYSIEIWCKKDIVQ